MPSEPSILKWFSSESMIRSPVLLFFLRTVTSPFYAVSFVLVRNARHLFELHMLQNCTTFGVCTGSRSTYGKIHGKIQLCGRETGGGRCPDETFFIFEDNSRFGLPFLFFPYSRGLWNSALRRICCVLCPFCWVFLLILSARVLGDGGRQYGLFQNLTKVYFSALSWTIPRKSVLITTHLTDEGFISRLWNMKNCFIITIRNSSVSHIKFCWVFHERS